MQDFAEFKQRTLSKKILIFFYLNKFFFETAPKFNVQNCLVAGRNNSRIPVRTKMQKRYLNAKMMFNIKQVFLTGLLGPMWPKRRGTV